MSHQRLTRRTFNRIGLGAALAAVAPRTFAQAAPDPLAPWRKAVKISPVAPSAKGHTIHTYYLVCPESPDGSKVLYYASETENAQTAGRLCVQDRQTGAVKVVAEDLMTEDAHRAALQQ